MRWSWLCVGVLACAALLGLTVVALAQDAPVRIVQAGDGTLYVLKGGVRYVIAADPIDDDELAVYADGGSLASGDVLAVLGVAAGASARDSVAQQQQQQPPADMPADQSPPPSGDQSPAPGDLPSATAQQSPSGVTKARPSGESSDQAQQPAESQPQLPSQ